MSKKFTLGAFLGRSNNVTRDSFIWNMLGTTLMAFQSVILLMVLTRVLTQADAGTFTFAYANANLLLIIGKYGIHNFQVSDTDSHYSFGDYRASRWITTSAMLIASAAFTVVSTLQNGYSTQKALVIFWMCLFKAVDVIEDVYISMYQQRGRLDVSGKVMTFRLAATLIFYIGSLIITRDLLISLIASTIFTLALFVILNLACRQMFSDDLSSRASKKKVFSLLKACFVLFLTGFLAYYITNAPKYSIDAHLSDDLQAAYGFISMPIFVIGLMGNYVFNPIIKPLSDKWNAGDISYFKKSLIYQVLIIIVLTAVCLIGAFFLGIPVLSLLYNTDLSSYRNELLVLIAGGGLLALANQLVTIITIIRRQSWLLIGYVLCSALALILSPVAVKNHSMMGAAMLELFLMLIICVIFAIVLLTFLIKAQKQRERQDQPLSEHLQGEKA